MKKIFTILVFLMGFFIHSSAQRAGDLQFGVEGGYIPSYKDFVYGAGASYSITDPLDVNLTFLMNPAIKLEETDGSKDKVKLYSLSLDFHYYILHQETWSMGPALGGQYMKVSTNYGEVTDKVDSYGFNVGWHMRYNVGENVVVNGGWRYTAATEDNSHHLFYVGVGYRFNLY